MDFKDKKLSQGEIFGVALLFVIVVLGFIVYAKMQALNNFDNDDVKSEGQYKVLAEGTLNTVKKMSTGCFVENHRDSVSDLINYCLENDMYPDYDPEIECDGVAIDRPACKLVINTINETLFYLFNNSDSSQGIANIPFEMRMDLPENPNTFLSNITFTNFGQFKLKGNATLNETNRRRYSYKRAPSGLISWSTSERNIQLELYLYYK